MPHIYTPFTTSKFATMTPVFSFPCYIHGNDLELGVFFDSTNAELRLVLLEHIIAVVLPELFASILPTHTFQDLWSTWMLINELCYIVHLIVNDDPEAVFDVFVRCDVFGGDLLRHVATRDEDEVGGCSYARKCGDRDEGLRVRVGQFRDRGQRKRKQTEQILLSGLK